jgi:hypothetical protein
MEKLRLPQKACHFALHSRGLTFYSVVGETSGSPKARPFFGTKLLDELLILL